MRTFKSGTRVRLIGAGTPSGRVQGRRRRRYSRMVAMLHTGKEPQMATSHFERFLDEATVPEFDTDCPLGPDCLYGLYISWCLLHGMEPKPDVTFRAAMYRCGIDIDDTRLRMRGPAAADYILSSYPAAA